MSTKLHDRIRYIDEAQDWLAETMDWLRPDLVCALEEWIALDLAGWRDGDPPVPAIEEERLRDLFGSSDPAQFFTGRVDAVQPSR